MSNKILQYICILLLFFSCNKESKLEQALKQAGKNRIELKKVLNHYSKDPKDKLKLKAARFLIENMDTYFFYASPEIEAYYNTLDSIFSLNENHENITEEQQALLAQLEKPDYSHFQMVPDLQYVSAGFLIDNIDQAFEAWKQPYAKDMNFNDFCEYLLPYKSSPTERPDYWRQAYRETFYPCAIPGLDISCHPDSGLISYRPSIVRDGNNYFSIPENFDTIPEFTVSCWGNPSEYRKEARLFDFGKDSARYVCFIPYNQEGVAQFQLAPDTWIDIRDSVPLPLAKSTHVAMAYSKNFISFYIDGVIMAKRQRTPLINKDMTCNYIGKSHNASNANNYFKGTVENFRIYNRELNYIEIHSLAGKKGLPEPEHRLQSITQGVRRSYGINTNYDPSLGGYRAVQLINMKQGTCEDYAARGVSIFRSLGIPSAIDFVPQWANRSMGHSWNALYTSGGRMADYSFGAIDHTVGNHIKETEERGKYKASKIFRKTYSKQPETPAMQEKGMYLPPLFQDPCIRDVTDTYLDCMDVTVSLTQQFPPKSEFAYLSNFNNQDWIPVHWGKVNGKKAVFTKMGKDIAYLPVYYDRGNIIPAADPFILTKEGKINKLIPDHSKKQTLILTRKYFPGNVPKKGELLVGGRFQVASKADFSDSLTVYVVNDIPEIRYNSVNLALNKPYRYFRFLTPKAQGGEISEIEIYSSESGEKLSGKVIGNKNCPKGWEAENVFDGNPLTSYKTEDNEIGWVGMDFGKPANIVYFRYLPRNDDNFIKEGEEYELFYWENYQWNSLGKQTGTSKQYLEYTNAPLNALFWLRNLTKGKEERIFTYENGKQVWW